jgi:hypothetical protein
MATILPGYEQRRKSKTELEWVDLTEETMPVEYQAVIMGLAHPRARQLIEAYIEDDEPNGKDTRQQSTDGKRPDAFESAIAQYIEVWKEQEQGGWFQRLESQNLVLGITIAAIHGASKNKIYPDRLAGALCGMTSADVTKSTRNLEQWCIILDGTARQLSPGYIADYGQTVAEAMDQMEGVDANREALDSARLIAGLTLARYHTVHPGGDGQGVHTAELKTTIKMWGEIYGLAYGPFKPNTAIAGNIATNFGRIDVEIPSVVEAMRVIRKITDEQVESDWQERRVGRALQTLRESTKIGLSALGIEHITIEEIKRLRESTTVDTEWLRRILAITGQETATEAVVENEQLREAMLRASAQGHPEDTINLVAAAVDQRYAAIAVGKAITTTVAVDLIFNSLPIQLINEARNARGYTASALEQLESDIVSQMTAAEEVRMAELKDTTNELKRTSVEMAETQNKMQEALEKILRATGGRQTPALPRKSIA